MTKATGIHDHPTLKLGLAPPKNAPALMLSNVLTGKVPAHPATADHLAHVPFGLYDNDQFGICGPTSFFNLVRLLSRALTGRTIEGSQAACFDLYRRSGNPDFDPSDPGGPGDQGVDMQTMLEATVSGGVQLPKLGTVRPVVFAKVDHTSDAEMEAACAIFGGILWGQVLEVAQQGQTDESPPVWDYSKSATWGGHATLTGAYEPEPGAGANYEDTISWKKRVKTTPAYRARQLQEAWAVIFEWNLGTKQFQEGVSVSQLAADYVALTGRVLPVVAS